LTVESLGATVPSSLSTTETRMSRDRDFRRPQRRSFDDDNYSPPANFGYAPGASSLRFEPAPAGTAVSATVKWYNPEKGFGFVRVPSGGDAFLHVSVVERSGNSNVPPGATLEVLTAPGQKGLQITEILSVDTSTALQEQPRRPRPERPSPSSNRAAVEEIGTVKWYNLNKGFGFIVRDSGGKDVFVHVSALNRGGLPLLTEGQRVAVNMVEGGKGPEAISVRLV
jgi:CspA family cold shock protein